MALMTGEQYIESIRKMKDAELEAALKEDYASGEDDTEK